MELDPLIGAQIDRYRIVSRIGDGGMGCVYKARHVELEVDFAIKVLYSDVGSSPTHVDRFRREARILSLLKHPNVVQVIDFGSTPSGVKFLVMEYVDGRTLAQAIATEGPFEPARAARITRQIAEALGAAHALGCVHRDVKPSNVMLTGDGEDEVVKLVDFGIVGLMVGQDNMRITNTGRIVGTPAYMAPEQAINSNVTSAADLYALGVILYEMLSGTVPFDGKSITEVLIRHAVEPVPPLQNAGSLEPLIRSLLHKNPERRPASAKEVVEHIDRWSRDDIPLVPVELIDPSAPILTGEAHERALALIEASNSGELYADPHARKNWRWAMAGGSACVALVIALATASLLGDDEVRTDGMALAVAVNEPSLVPEVIAALSPPRDLRAELDTLLAKRGLLESDLTLLAETAPIEIAWRHAEKIGDRAESQHQLGRLIAALEKARITRDFLGAKLDRVLAGLSSSRLPMAQLRQLEDEYYDLGAKLLPTIDGAERERLVVEISALQARISTAGDVHHVQ